MKSKRLKNIFLGTLAALSLYGCARVYYRLTDDFRLANITHDLSHEKGWDIPRLEPEEEKQVLAILDQPYTYIGKGAQCYAFESADHLYILKFFKFKHLRPTWFVQSLPPIYPFNGIKERAEANKKRKLQVVFNGYELAYKVHKNETEILFLHLNPTEYLKQYVTVYDKLGLKWNISLDDVVFLLQKKGETLQTRMKKLLKAGDIEGSKKAITQIFEMYVREYKKGIYDHDHGVMHNTGFVGSKPFHLDVGKFMQNETMRNPEVFAKDLEHVAWKVDTWVKNYDETVYAKLSPYISEEYKRLTGYSFDVSTINPERFKKKKRPWY